MREGVLSGATVKQWYKVAFDDLQFEMSDEPNISVIKCDVPEVYKNTFNFSMG